MPIVDLGATNVAKTAPRTNRVAATAKISVLIDEIGLDERIVVRGGLVLYIVVSMLIVGIACAAIVRSVRRARGGVSRTRRACPPMPQLPRWRTRGSRLKRTVGHSGRRTRSHVCTH